MFLKALTLRGFKSFADKTVLEFEPGVTVVVGPNGSGKSNLVDAVAWVLGAQGPRTVRGGKMDDVVFAGTPQRAALGRAEVSLTIDNSAGLLPIEFTEVTITRTLFRAGDSEYRINDAPCRLLDIQELLSDTGIGRQQHVIVGQGQIDTVLNARPEDRRAIIEEAAGILKYRKRRERAERRLESTEGSLLRLNDLLREVRRQLTPLQKQADAARRHDGVVEELRALRLHLAGHEIAGLQTRLERLRDRGHDLTRDEAAVQARLRDLDVAVLDAESALTIAGHGDLADALARIESLHARATGFGALLEEKSRGLRRELAAVADEGVFETLVADAANVREQLEQLDGEAARLVEARGAVEQAERELASALAALTPVEIGDESGDSEHASDDDVRAVRRELESRRTALARIDAELERVAARLATSSERGVAAESARNALTESRTQHSASLATSRATRASADAAANAAESAASQADEASRSAHRDAARWHARAEALDQALGEARSGSGIDAVDGLPGVVGPLVDHLEIDDGAGAAVAAVLGDALGAVVVDSRPAARAVVARLAEGDLRALLVVAGTAGGSVAARTLPPGAVALASKVHSRVPGLEATLARMLDGAVLVEQGWSAALDVALEHPDLTVVTGSGDRFGGNAPWRLGGDALGATRAALDEANDRASAAAATANHADAAKRDADQSLATARRTLAEAVESERRLVAELETTERALAQLDAEGAQREVDDASVQAERAALLEERAQADALVARLAERLPALELADQEARARQESYVEAKHVLDAQTRDVNEQRRTIDVTAAQLAERREVLERRLGEVEDRLARDPERRAEAERHRRALEARGAGYHGVADRLSVFATRVDGLLERWRVARRAEAERAAVASNQLQQIRQTRAVAERELVEIREHQQRREVDEAESRLRLETAVERLRTEYDVEPAAALDAPAPEVPEGTTLAGRARDLERDLRLMGPINPLALEEHDALQERHVFLQEQLEDVKASRRELMRVIRAVDHEITSVFEQAFADVAEHFSTLFATLFPGGGGKLSLTDPGDMLNTGIEMEARPSGKNVRRLSLLSGGERSLTAMAFLFAVFRARPSPFYLMDEVEAALDDVNLHRFLDLLHEFRNEAQLLVVSHQKRTMEAADCLYGVSMPPGGSSRVVSQRVRDEITLS